MLEMSCSFQWDWGQFVVGLLTTIIGFALTLYGQDKMQERMEKEEARKCLKSIQTELKTIQYQLQNVLDPTEINTVISMPVWDGLVNTYTLKRASKIDNEWYKELCVAYNLFVEFNKWNDIYTQKFLDIFEQERIRYKDERNQNASLCSQKMRQFLQAKDVNVSETEAPGHYVKLKTKERLIAYCDYLDSLKKRILDGEEKKAFVGLEQLILTLDKILGE